MASHNDSANSRAHALNVLSLRLGTERKVLSGNISIDIDGPTAHFYEAGAADRTITLPPFVNGGGTTYFIANVGASNDLIVQSANALAVITIEPEQATFIVGSESEWVPLAASAASISVFGPSGPGHSTGLVPDPGAVAGSTRYLREDGSWSLPSGGGSFDGYAFITDGTNTAAGTGSDTFKLRSSDSTITATVTNNDGTHGDNANLVVNEANVDHDALSNFVANEHIDHSTVSMSTAANSGLAGGGTIAATRLLVMDVNNLTLDTPVLADSFAFYDASGSDTNKATLTTLNGILLHDSLSGYSANRHIDHTAVSIQAGIGLSGGGDISATRTLSIDFTEFATDDAIAAADLIPFYDASESDHNTTPFSTFNAALDHNVLTNYDANKHIDHTAVSISAGGGLTGGGTIAATRTISLDITGQDSAAAVSGDEIIYWDISGSDFDKRSFASLITDLGIYAAGGTDVAVADGGTGASTLTGILQGNGTSAITGITNSSTVGQILRVTGAATYAWGALDLGDTDAVTGVLPFTNLVTGSARSVFGVTGNASATMASIQGSAGQILGVPNAGTSLAFTATPQLGVSGTLGSLTFGNATSGLLTLQTATGALGTVTVSIPAATDTLVNLTSAQELTNKTLTASVGKGTWTASGTWTLPAITLGGTVSGGGNNVNNVIIGAVTPLAGTFTTLTANTSILPGTDGAVDLGSTTFAFNNLHLDTGATINVENNNWLATHSSGILTVTTGDLRVTNNFTNATSVVTLAGAQTLTNKTYDTAGSGNVFSIDGAAAQGDVTYYNGTKWTRLAPGTSGWFLKTQGAGANPVWTAIAGGGDMLAANNLSDVASAAAAVDNLGLRETLTANRTYYVRTDGNDANTGLVNNAGGAFLTGQAAMDAATQIDFNGYVVTIKFATGTYTGGITVKRCTGQAGITSLIFEGDTTTPANVLISTTAAACFYAESSGISCVIKGFELRTTTSGHSLDFRGGSQLFVLDLKFGTCAGRHFAIFGAGTSCYVNGNYEVSGGAYAHWYVDGGAGFGAYGPSTTTTFTGTPAFTVVLLLGQDSAMAIGDYGGGHSFVGTCTGPKYDISNNASLQTYNTSDANLPGSTPGTIQSGGASSVGCLQATSATGFSFGTLTTDRRLHAEEDSAATNTVVPILRRTVTSQGTPAVGFGVSDEYEIETSAGNNEVGATTEAVVDLATAAAEIISFQGRQMAAGAIQEPYGISFLAKCITANAAYTNNNSAQPWFPSGGTLTLPAATTYEIEGLLAVITTGASTTHTTGLSFGGTATLTSIAYLCEAHYQLANTTMTTATAILSSRTYVTQASNTTVSGLSGTTSAQQQIFHVRGIVRINAAGTLIPQFTFSAGPGAGNVLANTWFKLRKIGSNTVVNQGNWA